MLIIAKVMGFNADNLKGIKKKIEDNGVKCKKELVK
jgi:ribosomal protein L10